MATIRPAFTAGFSSQQEISRSWKSVSAPGREVEYFCRAVRPDFRKCLAPGSAVHRAIGTTLRYTFIYGHANHALAPITQKPGEQGRRPAIKRSISRSESSPDPGIPIEMFRSGLGDFTKKWDISDFRMINPPKMS
jgi:hypothetical protein